MRLHHILAGAAAAALMAGGAHAANLIVNGDFETGDYTAWSANVEGASNGALAIVPNNGGNSPISGLPYQFNPAGGNFFSETDQGGPGSYSLTQSFTVAPGTSYVTVSFDQFANDYAGVVIPNGRDFMTGPNQNATADILTGGANAFTNNPADIVAVLYPQGADNLAGNPNPWTSYSFNLGALAPGTYQIRFAETDNQSFFNQGVDNVVVTAVFAVPEPATWVMMLVGFAGVGFGLRRRTRPLAA